MTSAWPRTALLVAVLVLGLVASGVGAARAAGQAKGQAAFDAGMAAARAGHYTAAVHDFEQALLQGHTDPNTFYQLGLAWSKLKDWNDATWALATAESDDVFSATTPAAGNALIAASKAGGVDAGPPPLLRNVNLTPMTLTPAQRAVIEARSAVGSLQGNDVYFLAPSFNTRSTIRDTGVLTAAAADLQNNSNTAVKFVFLSATPTQYRTLALYAKDLFGQLHLQRAIVVAITPQAAAAYSDRLSAGAAEQIAQAQRRTLGASDPLTLAAAIARAVAHRADSDDAANTWRSAALGLLVVLVVCIIVGAAVWRTARRGAAPRRATAMRRAAGRAR